MGSRADRIDRVIASLEDATECLFALEARVSRARAVCEEVNRCAPQIT